MENDQQSRRIVRLFFALFAVGILFLVFVSLFSDFMPPYRRLFWRVSLDNVLHFIAFALLGGVAPLAFRHSAKAFGALFVLMLLGFSLEFWQLYLPNRRCELIDASANVLGIVVGGGLGFWVRTLLFAPRGKSS
ncbi:VanZ family protein [Desulfovibrio ferrophilus]|uniref:Putative integral membrane protein n=1 Tax=Desulfovibrio ferrophilus TaxID=241368 RepID=A0A2Z6B0H8_9BACT|nr:VanZ family protein [Desulfovibrio ferrophilus]BBD09002.1 putative integral membrane protein [Desulfovibrio ferrophilus]